ncbi:MAG: hypothetical protein Q9210_005659 [Variospora velana]
MAALPSSSQQLSAQASTTRQRAGITQKFRGPVVFHWNALGAGSRICASPGQASIAWFEGAGGQWIAFEKTTGFVREEVKPVFRNKREGVSSGAKISPEGVEENRHLAGHEWTSKAVLARPNRVEKISKEVELSKELIGRRKAFTPSRPRQETSVERAPNLLSIPPLVNKRRVAGKHASGVIPNAQKTPSIEGAKSMPGLQPQQYPANAPQLGANRNRALSMHRRQQTDTDKLKAQVQDHHVVKPTLPGQCQKGMASLPRTPKKVRSHTKPSASTSYTSAPPASDRHGRQSVSAAHRTYDPLAPPFDFFSRNGYQPLDEDEDVVWMLECGRYRASRLSTLEYDPSVEPRLMTQNTSFWVIPNAKTHLRQLKRKFTDDASARWNTPASAYQAKPQKAQIQEQEQELAATVGSKELREPAVQSVRAASNIVRPSKQLAAAPSKSGTQRSVRDGRQYGPTGTQHPETLAAKAGSRNNPRLNQNGCPVFPRKRKAEKDDPTDCIFIGSKKRRITPTSDTYPASSAAIASTRSGETTWIQRPDLDIPCQSRPDATTQSEYADSNEQLMTALLESDLRIPPGNISTDWWNPTATRGWGCALSESDLLIPPVDITTDWWDSTAIPPWDITQLKGDPVDYAHTFGMF